MKDIYLTSTFRNDWNRGFNLKLVKAFEDQGYSVFAPQRDSEQNVDRKRTFEQDVAGMDQAKVVVAVGTKTQTANWGFEIGYAFKSGKPVIILTDKDHPTELLPEGAATKVFVQENLDDIEDYQNELFSAIDSILGKS